MKQKLLSLIAAILSVVQLTNAQIVKPSVIKQNNKVDTTTPVKTSNTIPVTINSNTVHAVYNPQPGTPEHRCQVLRDCDGDGVRDQMFGGADGNDNDPNIKTPSQDWDGDGHRAVWAGGDDCDDFNANRYPGNVEVCDEDGVDEDCNINTYGSKDSDGDGEIDYKCTNYRTKPDTVLGQPSLKQIPNKKERAPHHGKDPDDSQPAKRSWTCWCIDPATITCGNGGTKKGKCITQPNGLGVLVEEKQ